MSRDGTITEPRLWWPTSDSSWATIYTSNVSASLLTRAQLGRILLLLLSDKQPTNQPLFTADELEEEEEGRGEALLDTQPFGCWFGQPIHYHYATTTTQFFVLKNNSIPETFSTIDSVKFLVLLFSQKIQTTKNSLSVSLVLHTAVETV